MTHPGTAFETAAVTAIRAAYVTGGYANETWRVIKNPDHSRAIPYTILGQDTAIPFPTKTTEGTEYTHTFTTWSEDPDEVKTVSSFVLDALTDRAAPLSITGYTIAFCDLDLAGPLITDRVDDLTYYGYPVRVRYKLVQD